MTDTVENTVNVHYGLKHLEETILTALQKAGKDPEHFSQKDLEPVDQFHTRGKEATIELLQLASLESGIRVLDVGGGLGGTARLLAATQGCHVTVLDLTKEYCQVGARLTQKTGLSDQVDFQHGNALDMPFPSASFDAAWTQHCTMNIADKERLYREIHRVLRPGGKLVFFEILAGPQQPIHFPVPWASNPSISFLISPDELRALLTTTGFRQIHWQDTTPAAINWFRARVAATEGKPLPPLGLHLLLGPAFNQMFRNVHTNLEEQRISVVQAVYERL